MSATAKDALDSVDRFIAVGSRIAALPIVAQPDYRAAADDLYHICMKLLEANENMASCLYRFSHFNFRDSDARERFLELAEKYRTAKTGGELRRMKFNCGDIAVIYDRNIAGKLDRMFPQDKSEEDEARRAFYDLMNADDDMVAFIYQTVVGNIDKFLADAEDHVERSNLNGAEAQRLKFKVTCGELSERLERLGSGLSGLVLQYARVAGRPVTLD